MIDPKVFEMISGNIAQLMQGAKELPGQEAMQTQLKQMLQSSFAKLDLVTREEFDAQSAVLARTREKVEALEAKLTQIEVQLGAKD